MSKESIITEMLNLLIRYLDLANENLLKGYEGGFDLWRYKAEAVATCIEIVEKEVLNGG